MAENQPNQPKSGRGGVRPGSGRPKGSLDKGNAALREMILLALDRAGGVEYLQRQAEQSPNAFLSLIGKVLPTTLAGDPVNPVGISLNIIGRSAPTDGRDS